MGAFQSQSPPVWVACEDVAACQGASRRVLDLDGCTHSAGCQAACQAACCPQAASLASAAGMGGREGSCHLHVACDACCEEATTSRGAALQAASRQEDAVSPQAGAAWHGTRVWRAQPLGVVLVPPVPPRLTTRTTNTTANHCHHHPPPRRVPPAPSTAACAACTKHPRRAPSEAKRCGVESFWVASGLTPRHEDWRN